MSGEACTYLAHILESICEIEVYLREVTKESFAQNREKQSAVIRQLEIIGEAVKNLPQSFRAQYPHVAWEDFAGMRDVLIHHYFGVDLDLVWDAVKRDLPRLKKEIEEIVSQSE